MGTTTRDVSRWLSNIVDQCQRDRTENRERGLYGVTDGTVILAVLLADSTTYWRVTCRHDGATGLSEEGACPMGDTHPILDAWRRAALLSDGGEEA
jgi:hypothetical protein